MIISSHASSVADQQNHPRRVKELVGITAEFVENSEEVGRWESRETV
jgi:hypothetical protein